MVQGIWLGVYICSSYTAARPFFFPSAEIYGGTGAVWDFGFLGLLLKNNIKG